jgi:dipeptidyl-peptidase-3
MPEHKKSNVVGISYKTVIVAGESADSSPSTPIGVNLPNADWIRDVYGSKSVSLGNIIDAYAKSGGKGKLLEFANDPEEIALAEKYGELGDKLHTRCMKWWVTLRDASMQVLGRQKKPEKLCVDT